MTDSGDSIRFENQPPQGGGGGSSASSYETFVGGEAMDPGETFYVAANGKAYKPDGTEAKLRLTAYIVKTACTGDGASFEGWTSGLCTGLSGYTAGKRYFAHAGSLVSEDDLGTAVPSGEWFRELVHARSSTALFIDRQPAYPQA